MPLKLYGDLCEYGCEGARVRIGEHVAEENAAASAAKTDELSAHLFVRRADAHIYLAKRAATYSPCDAILVVHERASHWLPLGTGLHVSRFLLSCYQ
jgi:hypothetical protein